VERHLRGEAPTGRFLARLKRPEYIVDVGVYDDLDMSSPIIHNKVARGSRHFIAQDGLDAEQVTAALNCGTQIYKEKIGDYFDIIGVGELGVGNTLCAAAIATAVTGLYPDRLVGRGSTDHKVIAKKTEIVYRALEHRRPDANHATDILMRFGGLEIAALTGFILQAGMAGKLVMLDGYVTAVAALLANIIDDRVASFLIAPSLSDQRGHQLLLDKLGLEAVFDLGINYGEGLAAVLGMFLGELMIQ
jgi:nicotinate-nucleotide--dimethylbenzimidazole phosphoribosyltransferase